MSIQNQAMFWERSVCDISDELIKNFSLPDKLTSGLRAFSECLRTLYADYKTVDLSTDRKNTGISRLNGFLPLFSRKPPENMKKISLFYKKRVDIDVRSSGIL